MRTGAGNLTKQQAKIAAQEIINYAQLVERAVDRVRRNGCSEGEISFSNPSEWAAAVEATYVHTPASEDKCKVFNDNGGKLAWQDPNLSYYDSSMVMCCGLFGAWQFSGNLRVNGTGTSTIGPPCSGCELVTTNLPLKKEVCSAINEALGLGSDIPIDPGDIHQPAFSGVSSFVRSDEVPSSNKGGLCFQEQASNQRYIFYQTLIAR